MAVIDELLKLLVDQGASDLHLTSGAPPYLRVHGQMKSANYRELSNRDVQGLMFEILTEKQKKIFVDKWELDFAYTIPGLGRFRGNMFMQRKGLGGVFRTIPEKIQTVRDLSLPQPILDLIDTDRGLILVTGPTGSGKSTTLAALINHINATREGHIITIEDPIEFIHGNIKCLVNQRELGSHTKTFASALKSSLREDPDVILVGELRDLDTISLAITAAETGHLVFGTLHTNNASKTIDRVIDVFPGDQQEQIKTMLAESLRGVIAQNLFSRTDKPGRVAAFEILKNTRAVSNLIREGKTFQLPTLMQTGQKYGMNLFEKSIGDLVKKGIISKKDSDQFFGYNDTDGVPQGGVSSNQPNSGKRSVGNVA